MKKLHAVILSLLVLGISEVGTFYAEVDDNQVNEALADAGNDDTRVNATGVVVKKPDAQSIVNNLKKIIKQELLNELKEEMQKLSDTATENLLNISEIEDMVINLKLRVSGDISSELKDLLLGTMLRSK